MLIAERTASLSSWNLFANRIVMSMDSSVDQVRTPTRARPATPAHNSAVALPAPARVRKCDGSYVACSSSTKNVTGLFLYLQQ